MQFFSFDEHAPRTDHKGGIECYILQKLPPLVTPVVSGQCPHQSDIGATGGGGIGDVMLNGLNQVAGENTLADKGHQQAAEFGFPFSTVRVGFVTEFPETNQMRHLMGEGNEKSVLIQVVVDGYSMAFPVGWGTVIAKFTGAAPRDAYRDAVFHNPVNAGFKRRRRHIPREGAGQFRKVHD